ncbi:anthranilate phosphoribosyltransferase [Alkalicoccobacillus murimartini]|uniref:Anthranilate phosphoribosyltransferase n=1 Tax=Alkalicoccobacillus murimartini TaxID=171685 RepID=A0ABT9YDJ7_9BACI|nr:anthranilate phosphoribosyltransferase [Alkalicoccobacillus murimartini]MDQ0205923.1 anthranilate phosphoribosyltransferase [Alkalicoccobacillus murimartini]
MFKFLLNRCAEGHQLNEEQAYQAMDLIMRDQVEVSQIASLISMMRLRGESIEELVGFTRAMREHAVSIPHHMKGVLDTCGTGGDQLGTFNISTAVSFVAAAAGVPVAKHGNRAVTSSSGSADVLEHLGIDIQQSPEAAALALENKGLSFLFAPLYHASMKYAAPARKQIGFRTIFNLLGPMTNPAGAEHQLIGVSGRQHALKMGEAIRRLGTTHTVLVTGADDLDECSVHGSTQVVDVQNGQMDVYEITPEEAGVQTGLLSDIQVNSIKDSARLIEDVFAGTANASAESIVILNAGVALYAANRVESIKEGTLRATELVKSKQVMSYTNELRNHREAGSKHA